jgi:type II secretory pathway component PulJ
VNRRGGILLEILLSIAIFASAAAFTLGAARSVLDGLDRTQRRQQLMDLACTLMVQLETGLVTIAQLRQEGLDQTQGELEVDVETERTEFSDLSMVALTVRESDGGAAVTLRQLVALRPQAAAPYERDTLLDDLRVSKSEVSSP